MKKTLIYLGLIILAGALIWSLTVHFYPKKNNLLPPEKTVSKKILTPNDLYLKKQKEKALEAIKKNPLSFQATTEKLAPNKWKVTIKLQGEAKSAADAADLKLDLPVSASLSALNTGSAFPVYARKVFSNHSLLISGLASLKNNQIILGQPNQIFAEFIIELEKNEKQKTIILNKEDTKIYLNGEDVFDANKTFGEINLK
jgi:hypothetical protein